MSAGNRFKVELIWPPFKGKSYKLVDTRTGQSVGLYRTADGAKRQGIIRERAELERGEA